MRLTTVGTGTVAFTGRRVCAGHFLEAGATRILLDCGSGVAHRMAEAGLPWREITHLALTHFHADHVSDLPVLVQAWKYGGIPGRRDALSVIGPRGTQRLWGQMTEMHEWLREPGFPLTIVEIEPGQTLPLGDGATISAYKVPHTATSVAYSIVRGRRRVVYTGDTGYDPMFAEWALRADVLLCECSLPSHMSIPDHLTPEQCGAIAAAALPQHLVLTHFYPPVEDVDVRRIVGTYYAGPVTLATDGAAFEIEED